ncbi:MAG: hypothetical protein IPK01_02265 [Acidobacteria bacterium]|nr:hypothetical protein [Acidobacteriota bacterium]
MSKHGRERIYRDSVHNIIRVGNGSTDGQLLVSLIDTPEFQRLPCPAARASVFCISIGRTFTIYAFTWSIASGNAFTRSFAAEIFDQRRGIFRSADRRTSA